MTPPSQFAAQLLESSASAYAGYAASLLIERKPGIRERFAPNAMRDWKASLNQRILELSAALEVEEPGLFVSRVQWAVKAHRARELPTGDLRSSLVCLREVLDEQLPEAASTAAGRYLDQAIRVLAETPPHETMGLDPDDPHGRLALRYLQTVLEGDAHRAVGMVVAAVDEGLDPQDAYLDVLIPAQREIGGMWHLVELGIAEEHVVTAATERAMSLLAHRAVRPPANGKTMIAAAVAGNAHGLAVRVVADFFEMAGWRSICLGADNPPADLVAAAQAFGADLMVISAALATQIKAVGLSVDALRRVKDREVKILVGGGAFAEVPDLWRRLGADGHAGGAREAVTLGARLMSLTPS